MNRAFFLLFFALAATAFAAEWDVQTFDGRDYVSLDKIAAFYELPADVAPVGKTRRLSAGKRQLAVTMDSKQAEINGVVNWLAFPVIVRNSTWFVSRMDLGKSIEPAFRPERIPGLATFDTVVIDPGHGGHDKGAPGPYEFEKNFALDVSRRVRDELQKAGLKVVLTRNTDTFIELSRRASIANARANSIFVSIHFNAADWNRSATGQEIFAITPRGAPSTDREQLSARDLTETKGHAMELQSFALATCVYHALQGRMTMYDRGVKRARFAVLRLTKTPAVLIEGGFLTNAGDARLIATKEWRDKYARTITTGILEYKKLVDQKVSPRFVSDYRNPTEEKTASSPTPTPSPQAPESTGQKVPEKID